MIHSRLDPSNGSPKKVGSPFIGFDKFVNELFNSPIAPKYYDHYDGELPKINVKETELDFEIEILAIGFKKEDFKISVLKNGLSVQAESKANENQSNEKFLRKEFGLSSFKRYFQLPKNINIDAISAKYENGILKLSIPKMEIKAAKAKSITVN